mmetsp:Transcript_6076/g.20112  ORF Transcript_6076/g.20112 Transcript_6076/m.20112 type:complete len:242 (+) Transcript_6076:704-1429(+)
MLLGLRPERERQLRRLRGRRRIHPRGASANPRWGHVREVVQLQGRGAARVPRRPLRGGVGRARAGGPAAQEALHRKQVRGLPRPLGMARLGRGPARVRADPAAHLGRPRGAAGPEARAEGARQVRAPRRGGRREAPRVDRRRAGPRRDAARAPARRALRRHGLPRGARGRVAPEPDARRRRGAGARAARALRGPAHGPRELLPKDALRGDGPPGSLARGARRGRRGVARQGRLDVRRRLCG